MLSAGRPDYWGESESKSIKLLSESFGFFDFSNIHDICSLCPTTPIFSLSPQNPQSVSFLLLSHLPVHFPSRHSYCSTIHLPPFLLSLHNLKDPVRGNLTSLGYTFLGMHIPGYLSQLRIFGWTGFL